MFKRIKEDIVTVFERDPAAKNILEVILCYPGLHAIWMHRVAHFLYGKKQWVLARLVSHLTRFLTGVEIHPGARLGRKLFIDHGMGVVIGETAEVGENCLIYQGVVLGGTSTEKKKRHPTLRENVVVGAGAKLLGAIEIGRGSRIGAGSVVVTDVPPEATVVGIPGRVGLGFSSGDIEALEHGKLPDPVSDAIRVVLQETEKLEERIRKIESLEGISTKIDEYLEKRKEEICREFPQPGRKKPGDK